MLKKILKLTQDKVKVKYSIIISYFIFIIPLGIALMNSRANFVDTWLFRSFNIAGLLIFWFCGILVGRLSGVSQGYGTVLIMISVLVYEEFSFFIPSLWLFGVLFILGTVWIGFDLLKAYQYPSNVAKIDQSLLQRNLIASLIFFVFSYLIRLRPLIDTALLMQKGGILLNCVYYIMQILAIGAAIYSVTLYFYNYKKQVNSSTLMGCAIIMASSIIYLFMALFASDLFPTVLFFYVISMVIFGSILLIPMNLNDDSLKNRDLAREN